jgi:ABC-2 type transport system permease protein
VVAVSLPTVFAFYIIGAVGDVLGRQEVRYVSPFRYFDPSYVIQNQSLEAKYVVIGAAFVVVATALSYLVFVKKDIRSAI